MVVRTDRYAAGWFLVALAVCATSSGCARQYVLSPYASTTWVSRADDGSVRRRARPHRGVDIHVNSVRDPVIAAAPGEVIGLRHTEGAGQEVLIQHGRWSLYTSYVHLETVSVKEGDFVRRGDVLGTVGLFPWSAGVPHVHLEVCTNAGCHGEELDGTVDPMSHVVGCFVPDRHYPTDRFVLTYPVECD